MVNNTPIRRLTTEQQLAINVTAEAMNVNAREKGWYDPPKTPTEQMALWHSEVSEALEEIRGGHDLEFMYFLVELPEEKDLQDQPAAVQVAAKKHMDLMQMLYVGGDSIDLDTVPQHLMPSDVEMELLVDAGFAKPEGFPAEAADVIIRVMDTCAANGVDLGRAIDLKQRYNQTRPHRHGGKVS